MAVILNDKKNPNKDSSTGRRGNTFSLPTIMEIVYRLRNVSHWEILFVLRVKKIVILSISFEVTVNFQTVSVWRH